MNHHDLSYLLIPQDLIVWIDKIKFKNLICFCKSIPPFSGVVTYRCESVSELVGPLRWFWLKNLSSYWKNSHEIWILFYLSESIPWFCNKIHENLPTFLTCTSLLVNAVSQECKRPLFETTSNKCGLDILFWRIQILWVMLWLLLTCRVLWLKTLCIWCLANRFVFVFSDKTNVQCSGH